MSSFWSTFPRVQEGLDRVKARLLRQTDALPLALREELSPLLQREGKFLRAGLLLLSSNFSSEDHREAVESAAAGVELLHLATLIHDDIVDQAALRRGEPAFYRKVGASKAVLYGDFLLAACFRVVTQDVGSGSARALSDLVAVMAGSEIQQLNDRYRVPVSPRQILRKSMGKTALLFSLSLYIGATEGGRAAELAAGLRKAGYSLGMAFQLQDDLLDWTGDPRLMGKPNYTDLVSGVYTWPVALAWREDPTRTRRELADVKSGKFTPEGLKEAWLNRGYTEQTADLVNRYAGRAGRDLDRTLGIGSAERDQWSRFVERLLEREV